MTVKFEDENEVLAVVRASMGRRILGLVSLGFLGVLLIYVAFANPPSIGWQFFLILVGGASLWCTQVMRKSTSSWVELTPKELRDGDGTVIARIEDIQTMDRGFFAFKPSNGFLLKTNVVQSRVWRPGLWWRMGRRIGIGGMTPGSQTKYMSEILSALINMRDPHH
ncbi:hypothetical protein OS190_14810 [Sulfitobacter sp. F26204]|uniref:hypothetical protein n=1 Tax=Sulfitobacter sp. F26204 TaxID=2996014 RepID=UPI00225E3019|nr:hypothetical protein [Sulfitobacter sp. F26204]MCX7560845.1 hypothetical protein [Sulfitobacter sp. F26204]